MVHRTKPREDYIEPNVREITDKAEELELKNFSVPFVRDIANIASGGSYYDYDRILREVSNEVRVRPDNDGDYKDSDGNYIMTDDDNYVKDYNKARVMAASKKAQYHQNINNFIQELDLDGVPGTTPLTKAVNMVNILAKADSSNDNSEQDGQSMPIFQEKNGEQLAKDLNKIFEDIKNLDNPEKMLMEKDTDAKAENEQNDFSTMELASDMVKGKSIWLKISRKLESLVSLRTFAYRKTVADIEGKSVRSRPIENPNEINKLTSAEWSNPEYLRMFRIASRQAQIRERVSIIEKKQLLYMLIDSSGSMSGDRIHIAGGVLMNRLKAVVKGEAEVFIRFFDGEVYEEHHASNAEEAQKLMEFFEKKNFSGGSTRIAKALRTARDTIKDKMSKDEVYVLPEIVIVTDGEDDLRELKARDFKPTVVHSIIIENDSKELADFSRATGGICIQKL